MKWNEIVWNGKWSPKYSGVEQDRMKLDENRIK